MIASLVSGNPHKLAELRAVLPGWEIEQLTSKNDPPVEEGPTYHDNARIKARFGRAVGAADRWMLGEDSGIEVEALGGRPGPESARFGGDDPVGRLLAELEDVEPERRRARYVCELVCLAPDGEEFRGTGVLEGRVAVDPRGSEGFGYDPIFIPDNETRTVAELGDGWKAENSHRARAARALRQALAQRFRTGP